MLSGPSPIPSKAAVRAVQAMNRICVLDVDLQGVRNIKKTDLRPIYIFVQPPSLDVLVGAGSPGLGQGRGEEGWGCPVGSDPQVLLSGAAPATEEHRDRGESGQAAGRCPGRHGKQ